MDTPLQLTTDIDPAGIAILAADGPLAADTAPQLTAAVDTALIHHRVTRLVVDLARVPRLDTVGLKTLLRARDAVLRAGATFRVMRPHRGCAGSST